MLPIRSGVLSYGGTLRPRAPIRLVWLRHREGLIVRSSERGRAAVYAPPKSGFGLHLLSRAVGQFGGRARSRSSQGHHLQHTSHAPSRDHASRRRRQSEINTEGDVASKFQLSCCRHAGPSEGVPIDSARPRSPLPHIFRRCPNEDRFGSTKEPTSPEHETGRC